MKQIRIFCTLHRLSMLVMVIQMDYPKLYTRTAPVKVYYRFPLCCALTLLGITKAPSFEHRVDFSSQEQRCYRERKRNSCNWFGFTSAQEVWFDSQLAAGASTESSSYRNEIPTWLSLLHPPREKGRSTCYVSVLSALDAPGSPALEEASVGPALTHSSSEQKTEGRPPIHRLSSGVRAILRGRQSLLSLL